MRFNIELTRHRSSLEITRNKFHVRKLVRARATLRSLCLPVPCTLGTFVCALANYDTQKSHGRAKWLSDIEAYV